MEYCSFIKEIISFISQFCAGPISSIYDIKENVNKLRTLTDELKEIRKDVGRSVEAREANQKPRSAQEDGWLLRANNMEAKAEEIIRKGLEEIAERGLGGFCPKNCCASYQLGKELVRIIKDVEYIKTEGKKFPIVEETSLTDTVREMPPVRVTGMDLNLEKVWSCINNEDVQIIGIYGIGGVGKTTLLKQINNTFLHRQTTIDFDVVIWVVVSKEVNVEVTVGKIQDVTAKRVGLSFSEGESLHDRAIKLHSVLSGKAFVMLFDDIWEPLDLETIGIPPPDIKNKSKVLFTTRSEDVCVQMKAEMIKVECLGSAKAWKLFQEEVGNEALKSREIRAIAKQVAEECGGLPLALITTGKAMAGTKNLAEWKHQRTTLKKSASEFLGMKDKVYSILKFSYDRLPNDTIRSCFLYCSLFPEDHSIKKEQLIRYWIGEGFLDSYEDMEEAENYGSSIVGILKRACLLESGLDSPPEEVKMHDVLRDLALWIGCGDRNKFLVQAGVGLEEAPKVGKWGEAERISLMSNNIKKLGDEAPNCPELLTLIISENKNLRNISDGFFNHMHVLRFLDLSHTSIDMLPKSITKLVELEYLGLTGTNIKRLPSEMKKLVKLKCLDLSYTSHLVFIPRGILSRFLRLQVLDLTGSNFDHWAAEIGDIGQDHWAAEIGDIGQDEENFGAHIEELGCLSDLLYLSINIRNFHSLHIILGSEKLARCKRRLSITKCEQLTPMIFECRPAKQNESVLN